MELVIHILSWVLIVAGSLFAMIGGLGLLRLPDFYCRLHGAGITDTMGAWLILLGLILQAGLTLVAVKLVMIGLLLALTSPTATHALAHAALTHGLEPKQAQDERDDGEDTPSNT